MQSFYSKRSILLPNGEWLVGDVQKRAGEIVEIAPEICKTPSAEDKEIDATGLTLLPE